MDGKFVAIKMHFGELGNLAFLRPNYAKVVADLCKEQGGMPFLTDCNTLYPGSRKNALEHLTCAQLNGFWPMTTGCQVIIADGLRGTDEVEVPVPNGEYCKTAKIGRAIMDADIFISLTHFKGHEATGFGGAIKNIGMGCGSRAGKMEQHASGKPGGAGETCAAAATAAPRSAARTPSPTTRRTRPSSTRTSARAAAAASVPATLTPSIPRTTAPTRCWTARWPSTPPPSATTVPASTLALVQDISPNCDCHGENDAPILPDIGMFASFDPVALDQACVDACLNASPLPNSQLGQNLAKPGLELPPRQLQGLQPQHRVESHPRAGREDRHGHPRLHPQESLILIKQRPDASRAKRKGVRPFSVDLILALCLRHEGVYDILEGVPVLLREGQLLRRRGPRRPDGPPWRPCLPAGQRRRPLSWAMPRQSPPAPMSERLSYHWV